MTRRTGNNYSGPQWAFSSGKPKATTPRNPGSGVSASGSSRAQREGTTMMTETTEPREFTARCSTCGDAYILPDDRAGRDQGRRWAEAHCRRPAPYAYGDSVRALVLDDRERTVLADGWYVVRCERVLTARLGAPTWEVEARPRAFATTGPSRIVCRVGADGYGDYITPDPFGDANGAQ